MDYHALYKEGIEHIQQFSGAIWTDFNQHDPGVTILEYLCFGITDIGYRCNFPVTDLLYARENRRSNIANNAFYPPEKMLPCAALTVEDYRHLIIDRLEEVDNVWIEPVREQKEKFKGLYDIRLQLNKEKSGFLAPKRIKDKVAGLLAENRNLCEDIRSIVILEEKELDLEATIDLNTDASAEQVLAKLIHELEHFLTPKIVFYSFEEMLAAGADINVLLDGPEPVRGYIDTANLPPLPTAVYVSQIRDLIAAIDGVQNIDRIRVKLNRFEYAEEIVIPDNSCLAPGSALYDLHNTPYPLRFTRNGNPVTPNASLTEQLLKAMVAREYQHFNRRLDLKPPQTTTTKDLADIGAYYSIQRFFPAVYGIGAYGLPANASFQRLAQARQLKGYLSIFETLLASYLKQLTQLRLLFSIGEKKTPLLQHSTVDLKDLIRQEKADAESTYFSRFPTDIPDIEPLLRVNDLNINRKPDDVSDQDTDLYEQPLERQIDAALKQISDIQDQPIERHNKFLDHLLARFGESVDTEWMNPFLTQPGDFEAAQKSLIHTKRRILQDYVTLSRDRGKGFNFRASEGQVRTITLKWQGRETETWVSDKVSALKKRLCCWLNLGAWEDRALTDFFPFDDFTKPTQNAPAGHDARGLPLRSLLRSGRAEENYDILQSQENNRYVVCFRDMFQAEPYPLFSASGKQEAEKMLQKFIESVNAFNWYCQGFFIVEHLLLRPLRQGNYRLKLDTDPGSAAGEKACFESLLYHSLRETENIAEDLLVAASNKDNYAVLQDDQGYFVLIKQNKRPILLSTRSYALKRDAENLRDKMVDLFKETLETHPGAVKDWIEINPVTVQGMEIDNAFYAHRLSIVLPNWPGIFMEKEFQAYFGQVVARSVPAHLRADILWLDWARMKTFETNYKNWLIAKSKQDPDIDTLDDLSLALLKTLHPVEEDILVQDSKKPARVAAIMQACTRAFLFKPSELQIIQGIDADLEFQLNKENIGTWTLLSIADARQLQTKLKKSGVLYKLSTIQSWINQAKLAIDGNWPQLEAEQRSMAPEAGSVLEKMTEAKKKSLFGI